MSNTAKDLKLQKAKLHELVKKLSNVTINDSGPNPDIANILSELKQVDAKLQAINATTPSPAPIRGLRQDLHQQVQSNHFVWCIEDFRNKFEQKKFHNFGTNFYTAPMGYHVTTFVQVYEEYMGIFLGMRVGNYDDLLEWPFEKRVSFTLFNQIDRFNHKTMTVRPSDEDTTVSDNWDRPVDGSKKARGFPKFIQTAELIGNKFSSPYLRNNRIAFLIEFS